MKLINLNLKWIPEFYFILVAILWFYLSANNENGSSINFAAVIMIVVFQIQLFLDDQYIGTVLAGTTAIATLYLTFNLIRNLSMIYTFDESMQIYTLQSGNLILLNFIMSMLMFNKYSGKILKFSSEVKQD